MRAGDAWHGVLDAVALESAVAEELPEKRREVSWRGGPGPGTDDVAERLQPVERRVRNGNDLLVPRQGKSFPYRMDLVIAEGRTCGAIP